MARPKFAPSDIFGVLPPMTTPFDSAEEIDFAALRRQAKFLMDEGAHGIVAGGSAGEGYALSTDELRAIVDTTCQEVGDRMPVVAGVIVNSTRQAIEKARAVADLGVSALQITPVHYIYKPGDDATFGHFADIAEAVDLPIILYNVIPWNYIPVDQLLRLMDDIPQVIGVKQSAGDLKLLADLMITARPEHRIYAAIDPLLYPTFALGAHGAISQILAAVPGPCVRLWDAVQAKDHDTAREIHEGLLRLWHAIYSENRVAVTKHVQILQGCPGGGTRRPTPEATPEQKRAVREPLAALVGEERLTKAA
ncbi:dihydrodipicolinate synthase family protein [Microbaculum marinum]|uniref:Dihydrodipicolinate synthase family protein n=1 Tax=Microbaculum marinum TaxID=1764581 RepID=A0AAW9RI05_9HYPH